MAAQQSMPSTMDEAVKAVIKLVQDILYGEDESGDTTIELDKPLGELGADSIDIAEAAIDITMQCGLNPNALVDRLDTIRGPVTVRNFAEAFLNTSIARTQPA